MALQVRLVALDAIRALRPLMARIARHDRALATQLRRAASSVALNIGEAEQSDPGNKRARLFNAAGSANEARVALDVAIAWGYLDQKQADEPSLLLDRTLAMLWRLNHTQR